MKRTSAWPAAWRLQALHDERSVWAPVHNGSWAASEALWEKMHYEARAAWVTHHASLSEKVRWACVRSNQLVFLLRKIIRERRALIRVRPSGAVPKPGGGRRLPSPHLA